MAENRSPNPPRRSGRINIGEPAQKLGSWCSGAELDGEVEQKSQASTSRSSPSARVAAGKLREAKLHAEEAKALLEKEKSRKTTGDSIRLEGPLMLFPHSQCRPTGVYLLQTRTGVRENAIFYVQESNCVKITNCPQSKQPDSNQKRSQ